MSYRTVRYNWYVTLAKKLIHTDTRVWKMLIFPPQNDGLLLPSTPCWALVTLPLCMRKHHQCLKSREVHFITIILGGNCLPGWSTKWVSKDTSAREPTQEPTTHNTQQQDEPPPPYPPAALPSISMKTAATAPAVGSATPYGSRSGARRLVIAHRASWFPFGTPK